MASPISIIINAQNSASGALGGLVNSITGVSRAVGVAQRDFQNWQSQIRTAESNINDLRTRMDTLRSMGVQPNSQAFRDLAAQLGAAEANLRLMRAGAGDAETRLRTLQASATATGTAVAGAGAAATAAVLGFAALGAAVAGVTLDGFAVAIKGAADFESALARVQAAAGVSGDDLRRMRVLAMEIGPAFGRSASETVEAMGELAKAGMSMENVLGGGAKAVVALSTATGEDMTKMAELLSKSIAIFRDSGLTASEAADLVAKTANASAIGVGQFGFSLAAVGPIAASAGLNFEELSTAIGILGNNALVGSDGGTSLKSMLMALTPTAKPAIAAMEALGVKVFDAAGKSRDFRSVLGDLQNGIRDLTDQERITTLEAIFGSDGSKAAIALLKDGVEGWDAFMGAMKEAPAVTDQANTRMNTLTGTLDRLKAGFGNLVVLAGTPFLGMLQVVLGKVNSMVSSFDIGRADAMSNALKGLLSTGDENKRIGFYNQLADAIGNPKLAEGIAIATSGMAGLWQIINGDWTGGSERVQDAINQLTTKFDVKAILGNARASVGEFFNQLMPVFTEYGPMVASEAGKWTQELWKWIQPAVEPTLTEIGKYAEATADRLAKELPPKAIAALGKTTVALVGYIADNMGPAILNEFGRQKDIIADGLLKWDFNRVGESWFASIVAGLVRAAWNFNPIGIIGNAMQGAVDAGTAAGTGIAINNGVGPVHGPQLPGNAEGTDFWRGGLTWVGERGPELLDLPTGSSITNHQQSMRTMNDMLQSVNLGGINIGVNVNGGGEGGGMTAKQIMAQALPMIEQQLLERLNGALEMSRSQVVAG